MVNTAVIFSWEKELIWYRYGKLNSFIKKINHYPTVVLCCVVSITLTRLMDVPVLNLSLTLGKVNCGSLFKLPVLHVWCFVYWGKTLWGRDVCSASGLVMIQVCSSSWKNVLILNSAKECGLREVSQEPRHFFQKLKTKCHHEYAQKLAKIDYIWNFQSSEKNRRH